MKPLYEPYLKRAMDICLSLGLFVLTFPLILLVTILLALAGQGRPLFLQRRTGRYGRPFIIVKFRTMDDRTDSAGALLPDEERLTPLGRVIRSLSIDELPQLLNVLWGDMSMVGPRPLLLEYLPLYNEEQRRRHEVRPGITGWAQVNGRNTLGWTRKFEHDVWYVDHCSLGVDLRILLLTLQKVCVGEGIASGTSATMEKFSGSL